MFLADNFRKRRARGAVRTLQGLLGEDALGVGLVRRWRAAAKSEERQHPVGFEACRSTRDHHPGSYPHSRRKLGSKTGSRGAVGARR
jgi:hypothetical protein